MCVCVCVCVVRETGIFISNFLSLIIFKSFQGCHQKKWCVNIYILLEKKRRIHK